MHTLLFHEPGHFHAALLLREANARVEDEVHLYARPGPEREAFVDLVAAFNRRERRPTAWRVRVHEARDPLERLAAERRGDVVILAGRNDGKLETIAHLHGAGFNVLADKPWLTRSEALAHLERVTAGPPLVMDIMTGRHDVAAGICVRLCRRAAVFGELDAGGEAPAIELSSVHHLYKVVNGVPLRRPPWYYDVDVQGDGMVDIQSHMVDQVQWVVDGDDAWNVASDLEILGARRWSTPVPLALYRESTGEDRFPAALAPRVRDNVLALDANGEIDYRLRGVPVRQRAEWRGREPPGGGDLHGAVLRGSRARVLMTQGSETGFRPEIRVDPAAPEGGAELATALGEAVADWRSALPGLAAAADGGGFLLHVPPALDGGHESHFPLVLDAFLDRLDAGGWDRPLAERIRLRYTLLARARELALRRGA